MKLYGTMHINERGHLMLGGVDALELAEKFGTPLYVLDEELFRRNCRTIKEAFVSLGDANIIYASKALCTKAACIMAMQEGLGLDVVSGGELYTALSVKFPPEKIYFHGNNKTPAELEMAVTGGVGTIVIDSFYEMELLESICSRLGMTQRVMLRISPGIEAHTHEYVQTGQIDSKFGFTLPNGQALEAVKGLEKTPSLRFTGLHCHIGSQIFEMESFVYTAQMMMDLVETVRRETGFVTRELNLGGGFGIYYVEGDLPRQPSEWAEAIMSTVRAEAERRGLPVPRVVVEPGRAIVGPAGITLYTVGAIKEIPGVRKYIAVDGGMGDNPRPALYGSKYEALLANKAGPPPQETVSVAGKCCESGDMLIWDLPVPRVKSGDLLAVFNTGAYNYAMSMNYNRIPRPAMVLVGNGRAELIVRRESYEDVAGHDVIPAHLLG